MISEDNVILGDLFRIGKMDDLDLRFEVVTAKLHDKRKIYGDLGVSCIMCWYVFGRRAFPLLLDEQACPAHSLITKVLSQPFSTASDAKHPLPNTIYR